MLSSGRRDGKQVHAIEEIVPVTSIRDLLGEGPTWDANRLLRVDILEGKIHSLDPNTGRTKSLRLEGEVSAVIPRANGGLVLAIDHEIVALDRSGERETLAIVEDERRANRFNDCRCDAAGRLWAGTMSKRRESGAAGLYCLEAGRSIRCAVPDTTLSNGIGWSPDGERMYFIDSTTQRVDVFAFDVVAGEVSNRRTFAVIDAADGMPDGLTVDADGGVWVCLFGGSAVRRYTPDGRLDEVVGLPVTHPTCPAFGGPGLRTLFITSTRHRLRYDELLMQPLAGAVLRFEPGVRGLPAHRFAG